VADNELRGFTFLPGAFFVDTEEAAILRVRMQRGALGALGLPVNEERASEWIQVICSSAATDCRRRALRQ